MTDALLAPLQTLNIPAEDALKTRAELMLTQARELVIDSDTMYEVAADELKAVKAAAKKHEEERTALVGPLNQVVKAINARFKPGGEFLENAEAIIKRAMLTWQRKKEAEAAEEHRRAEEAAAAERRRLEAEAAEQRRLADEAAAAGNEAAAAEAASAAEAVAMSAAVVVAAPLAMAAPKVRGISTAKTVDIRIDNLHELVKHIAERPELIGFLKADETKIRAYAKGLGMATQLPGVHVFEKDTLRAAA